MNEALSGLVAIIVGGAITLLGTIVSFILTTRKERLEWERDKLLEAYSNSIYFLTAVMNWHYTGAVAQTENGLEKYLADCNQADRWVQLFYVLYKRGDFARSSAYEAIEKFVNTSLPEDEKQAEPWSLKMAYNLLRNVRTLGQEDKRLLS